MSRSEIDRALAGTTRSAQPSSVVAREVEFLRMADETGERDAALELAAPGARIQTGSGPADARSVLSDAGGGTALVEWETREVWMSCDAAVAVSSGRYREKGGTVGTYLTVWQRRADESYEWVSSGAAADDPQPPPPPSAPLEPGEIEVTAMKQVYGRVADCEREVGPAPAMPGDSGDLAFSPDRTLGWRWFEDAEGRRTFDLLFLTEGEWTRPIDVVWPARTIR